MSSEDEYREELEEHKGIPVIVILVDGAVYGVYLDRETAEDAIANIEGEISRHYAETE